MLMPWKLNQVSLEAQTAHFIYFILTHGKKDLCKDTCSPTSRHWNETYQKNNLPFREHVNDRNNISVVAAYCYYFMVRNQVFGEMSIPEIFQLRKAEKRFEDTMQALMEAKVWAS